MWSPDTKKMKVAAVHVKNRLVTREDPIHVHKLLGLFALGSFLYRYAFMYNTVGNLGFNGSSFDWLTMFLHLGLSSSSLIFHVLSKRSKARTMMIWEEYRLHAIVFTLRCFLVYSFAQYRPYRDHWMENVLLYCTVMFNHVVADWITRKYGDKSQNTVRLVKDETGRDWRLVAGARVYAFYQFLAIASHLQPTDRMGDMGYNTLIAIQSSAFLMTLFRKGLIKWYSHAFWYTTCLLVSAFHIMHTMPHTMFFIAKVALAFYMRTQLRFNKYFIWALFSLSTIYDMTYPDTFEMYKVGHDMSALVSNAYDSCVK